jgi:hypothetical protein
MAVPFLRVTEEMHSAIPSPPAPRTSCLDFCFIYGAWTLITKKGRRLDAEIKRAQNAAFRIPAMAMGVECIMRRIQSERMRSYNMRTTGGSREPITRSTMGDERNTLDPPL